MLCLKMGFLSYIHFLILGITIIIILEKRKVNFHGGYIPSDPRSKYEKLMHINEQNPRILHKQLKKNFKYVTILFNSPNDPIGNFSKKVDTIDFRDIEIYML